MELRKGRSACKLFDNEAVQVRLRTVASNVSLALGQSANIDDSLTSVKLLSISVAYIDGWRIRLHAHAPAKNQDHPRTDSPSILCSNVDPFDCTRQRQGEYFCYNEMRWLIHLIVLASYVLCPFELLPCIFPQLSFMVRCRLVVRCSRTFHFSISSSPIRNSPGTVQLNVLRLIPISGHSMYKTEGRHHISPI